MSQGQSKPLVSVIMVDGGFRENFDPLTSWMNQSLPSEDYELIWVEYTDHVAPEVGATDRFRTFSMSLDDEPQVLPRAYNEGIRRAKADILVIPDADVYCEHDLLETIADELASDPREVLYILRLDQPRWRHSHDQTFEDVRETCSIRRTQNYGGCVAIHRERMIEMNGYEQLPFFAGYHQSGFDNYIRFKNMGLKICWHPTQRVYHPWHEIPGGQKFSQREEQKRFIARRAAAWDYLAYHGLDETRNRDYAPETPLPTDWANVMTERGLYRHAEGIVFEARPEVASPPERRGFAARLRGLFGKSGS
ncbi:MAG: glycosyltransferase [Planctomycetota bacterium]